jgi:hypothetical protein
MASLTWKDLAAELGVSAFSLHRWRHLEGAPANPDLKDWQDFKAQRGLGRDRAAPELAALKAELLREQIKRERARNSLVLAVPGALEPPVQLSARRRGGIASR